MDDDPPDRDPEPFGAHPGESERSGSDPARDDDPSEIGDEDEDWTSEILVALTLAGVLLLLAGLLFGVVSLSGFGGDGGDGTAPAGANNTPNATDVPNTTNETNASAGGEDVQEDDDAENDAEPAPADESEPEPEPEPGAEEPDSEPAPEEPEEPEEPTDDSEPEPEPAPEPEPEPEPEPNETEPDNETEPGPEPNETEPGNETGNETNVTDPQPGATAVVQVLDQDGAPVEGEPVTLIAADGSESTRTTDENGEVVIDLVAGDPSDVARFDVRIRDQEQTVFVQRDDVHGVQEVVFEVDENPSDPAGNATNETNETVAVIMEAGL